MQGGLAMKERKVEAQEPGGVLLRVAASPVHLPVGQISAGATAFNGKAAALGRGLPPRPGCAPCRSPSVPTHSLTKGFSTLFSLQGPPGSRGPPGMRGVKGRRVSEARPPGAGTGPCWGDHFLYLAPGPVPRSLTFSAPGGIPGSLWDPTHFPTLF